jgi:hypothetical protein
MADTNHRRRFFAEGSQSLNHMLVGLGKVPGATALEALADAARGLGGAFGAAILDNAPAAERDAWRDRILLELLHGAGDVIASETGKGTEP